MTGVQTCALPIFIHPLAKNPSSFAKHTTIPLLSYTHSLTLHILKYIYLIAFISKYLNTSPYSSLTKIFLLESNLYNFSSSYNLKFLLSLTSISLILPYIIYITNTTSPKISISFTISTLLKRY